MTMKLDKLITGKTRHSSRILEQLSRQETMRIISEVSLYRPACLSVKRTKFIDVFGDKRRLMDSVALDANDAYSLDFFF